jgi:hypothetical protein
MIHIRRSFRPDELSNLMGTYTRICQNCADPSSGVLNHVGCEGLMLAEFCHRSRIPSTLGRDGFPRFFECVTERTMPYVVKKRGKERNFGSRFIEPSAYALQLNLALNQLYESTGIVKYSDGMREAAMCRRWENKLGYSELLYPTQPLQIGRLDQFPNARINETIVFENDDVMDRVSDAFWLH